MYIVKNRTGNFDPGYTITRAFPNRFWLSETLIEGGILVPDYVRTGMLFFDFPNGKKLRVNPLEGIVADTRDGTQIFLNYTEEQIAQRQAFKRWLVDYVYTPDAASMGIALSNSAILDNALDDRDFDKIFADSFYYDL